ncbi:hypothetical protein JCM30471_05760 [Desulfuromonas carbonis]|uniref:hypothetical protein n=1 Tax=Desulfuromonas sp. DDH964 TaxID=1823759 RepID=UPI00078C90EB|nr:hypothetical protein [Desulfuromonas sp. DDH964]AMV72076.1 hypothetical protein DBW_1718 [Desulfuromonas sp. DDH964]
MPFLIICLILFCSSVSALAAPQALALNERLTLEFDLPAGGWVFGRNPPDFLLRATVADLTRELAGRGEEVESERVTELARQRLGANEGFVYQPESESLLLIDFSPLRAAEKEPAAAGIERSAEYAAASLAAEEGVSEVVTSRRPTSFPGLTFAWRIESSYRLHGEPRRFLGIVGFHAPFWVYLYYTERGGATDSWEEMNSLLKGARVVARE